jgi:hypothetical protein
MRTIVVLGVSALALAACQRTTEGEAAKTGQAAGASVTVAAPGAMPKRKPGLWTQTVSSGGATQSMKICLDADTDAKLTAWGQAIGDNSCSKNSFAPAPGGGWMVESECEMGEAGRVSTKGKVTGDFASAYEAKMTSSTTGAAMAQMNGVRDTTVSAKWEGPCPADMTPGDVRLANGMTINVESMAGR